MTMYEWPIFVSLVLILAIHRETRVSQLDPTAPRIRAVRVEILKFSAMMLGPWAAFGEAIKFPTWFSPVLVLSLVWGMLMFCNENVLRGKS